MAETKHEEQQLEWCCYEAEAASGALQFGEQKAGGAVVHQALCCQNFRHLCTR